MKTKEAIEFLEHNDEVNFNWRGNFKHIVVLLKRGEKYEEIFNTILNWTIHDGSFIPAQELINLEQKYFPKEE